MGQNRSAEPGLVRFWVRLAEQRKLRETEQLFVLEGFRSFHTAVQHGFEFHAIIFNRKLARDARVRREVAHMREQGVRATEVSIACFRKYCRLPRASGVAAIVRPRWSELPTRPRPSTFFVAVTRLRADGNLGTLLRSLVAAGCDGLIAIGDEVDPYAPAVIRASMGAVFVCPLVRTSWQHFHRWKASTGIRVVGATGDAERTHFENEFKTPTVIMLGEERRGLSSRQREHADEFVRIPMSADCDSLNVGVAGSLLAYEVRRQLG